MKFNRKNDDNYNDRKKKFNNEIHKHIQEYKRINRINKKLMQKKKFLIEYALKEFKMVY